MHDAQRYRRCAADCLRAAYGEGKPNSRGLRVSMAASWLSLADRDEAMDELLAQWERVEPGLRQPLVTAAA
jgi:hypothetical protein